MEIVVAIGVVLLVSLGLAKVFQTIGQTVSAGQRASAMSALAASVERQMRQDFAAMTRDGVLVIRNQFVRDPASPGTQLPVPLTAEDPLPRRRRMDEIAFFAKGDFTSARQPLNPGLVARGGAARIYYGHGLKTDPSSTDPAERRPASYAPHADARDLMPGITPALPTQVNPNRYASDWTLLRHVTVLSERGSTRPEPPADGWIAPLSKATPEITDSRFQVALQPAASSVFRSVAAFQYPGEYQGVRYSHGESPQSPIFDSGLVDVATTSLAEIRAVLTSLAGSGGPTAITSPSQYQDPTQWKAGVTPDMTLVGNVHAWAEQLLPTQSDFAVTAPPLSRIRYADSPPDYLGVLNPNDPDIGGDEVQRAYRRADQLVLTSWRFAPRCSEFIVEWSFGQTKSSGELIWYGTTDGDGSKADVNIRQYALPASDKTSEGVYQPYSDIEGTPKEHGVECQQIYGTTPAALDPATRTLCFSYLDLFYKPSATSASDPPSLPAAWPRLLRITLRLVDPRDPLVEEPVQFIVECPPVPAP